MLDNYSFVKFDEFSNNHLTAIISTYKTICLPCLSDLERLHPFSSVKQSLSTSPFSLEITPQPFGFADNKLFIRKIGTGIQTFIVPNDSNKESSEILLNKFSSTLQKTGLFKPYIL